MGSVDSRLTIVHCLAPASTGGLESVVRMLAQGQQDRGHRVVVAAVVDDMHHPFIQSLDGSGIEVRTLVAGAGGYRKERRFIEDLLRDVTADVLHTHGYRPDIIDLGVAETPKSGDDHHLAWIYRW